MHDTPIPSIIDFDHPCTSCGYNLRGLDPSSRCPECGAEITESMRGDLLRFANPTWLKTVLRGANLMYYSILLGMVIGLGVGLLGVLAGSCAMVVAEFVGVIAALCNTIAVWMITTQEPRESYTERQITWRRILRFCAITNLALMTLTQSSMLPLITLFGQAALIALQLIKTLTGVLATFGYFAFAEGFAQRIPDASLARRTRIVKWGLAVPGLLSALVVVTVAGVPVTVAPVPTAHPGPVTTAPSTTPPTTTHPATSPAPGASATSSQPSAVAPITTTAPATPPATRPSARTGLGVSPTIAIAAASFGCVVGVGYLIFGIWAIILLRRYRTALHEAITQSTAQ